MKPAEQRLQLERQKLPLEFSNSIPGMDLDGATGAFARRTGAPLPPARPLLERRRSLGQEMPRSPASRQTGQPGARQSGGGVRSEGRGSPGQLDALAGRAG